MKRVILVLFALLLLNVNVNAKKEKRHTIEFINGSILSGITINEINSDSVMFTNQNGRLSTIALGDVLIIKEMMINKRDFSDSYNSSNDSCVAVKLIKDREYKKGSAVGYASFLLPGLGQMFTEEYLGGALFFLTTNALVVTSLVLFDLEYKPMVSCIPLIAAGGVWICSIIDASLSAKRYNSKYGLALSDTNDKFPVYMNFNAEQLNNNDFSYSSNMSSISYGLKFTIPLK